MDYETKPAVSTDETGFSGINFGIDDLNPDTEVGYSGRTIFLPNDSAIVCSQPNSQASVFLGQTGTTFVTRFMLGRCK